MLINLAHWQSWYDEFSDSDQITMEILSFRRLKAGWYFGVGDPPSAYVAVLALHVANLARQYGATSVEAFPDSDGGILIAGYYEQETVEIFCQPDGMVTFTHEKDDREVNSITQLDARDVASHLGALKWQEQNSSDFFTRFISAGKNRDTKVSLSRTLLREEFLSSILRVSPPQVPVSVTISSSTMRAEYPETRQSSGDLTWTFFLEAAA